MKLSTKAKTLLSMTAVLLVFILVFVLVNLLLQPKYMTSLPEGSMISQYYSEAGGHDVIFIGDCDVYANFSPMEMYREYGITAYVRGTPQQLMWQSYYILEETLTYETPKVVVLGVSAMRYGDPVSEAYNRLTIDRMRWSASKLGIIQSSMTEEEDFWSYVFPVLRYHSRFDELTQEDITYLFQDQSNTFNGYQMNKGVVPVGTLPAQRPLADYSLPQICYEYLDRIRLLCAEKGVELVLIKPPSLYPYWYTEYHQQLQTYADEHQMHYINFLD